MGTIAAATMKTGELIDEIQKLRMAKGALPTWRVDDV